MDRKRRVVVRATAITAAAIAVGVASASGLDMRTTPILDEIGELRVEGVVSGMAVAERRLPKGSCIRFTACVLGADPEHAIQAYLAFKGYKALRWCSGASGNIPTGCQAVRIDVTSPQYIDDEVTAIRYELSGAVSVTCERRVEGVRGDYRATTIEKCEEASR